MSLGSVNPPATADGGVACGVPLVEGTLGPPLLGVVPALAGLGMLLAEPGIGYPTVVYGECAGEGAVDGAAEAVAADGLAAEGGLAAGDEPAAGDVDA